MTEPEARARLRAEVLLPVALAVGLSVFAWWTALTAYPKTQAADGWQHYKMLEAARWSVLRYHEFPGWNAYECGGVPLWDNPQSFVGAPLAWLTLLTGTSVAILVFYVIHSALGFLSMWVLLRLDLRLSRVACLIGSAMWAWSGFHQQHYGIGHVPFVPFEYFPLALFLWRRAESDLRSAVGLGVLVAWMIYEGGVYPLPHLVIVLAIESAFRVWPARRSLAMARAGVVVLAVALTVGASRFIPVLHQLHIHDRALPVEADSVKWSTLKNIFLARDFSVKVPGQEYKWHEYGAYVGPFLLTIAFIGVIATSTENAWLATILTASFALMLGHFARWAPWTLLHAHVFPFKQMRVPSRFVAEVTLALSAFAALAIDRVPALLRTSRRQWARPGHVRAALLVFGLLGLGDMMAVGLAKLPERFNRAPSNPGPPSPRLYLEGKKLAQSIDQPAQNRGRMKCWDEWGFEKGAHLWAGDVPQARVRDEDADIAVVKGYVRRTQSSFGFVVDAKANARVLLNTSYDAGWHTSVGTVVDNDKLLAVDVPEGLSRVSVHYWPYGLTLGLWLTGLGVVGVAGFFVWSARTRRSARSLSPSSPPSRP